MNYSIVSIVENTELENLLEQSISKLEDQYALVLHSANSVLAASMLGNLSAQIVIIQVGLSFYSENWFIRDVRRGRPDIRYILLKYQNQADSLLEDNRPLVSDILEAENITPERVKESLDRAARDYEKYQKTGETVSDESRWQNAYMKWLYESNFLAGALGGTLAGSQIFRLDSNFSPGSFVLVIGENQAEPKWTFYNQNPVFLGKIYRQLEGVMDRLGGLVLIASEKKLCFLFNANQENQEEKLKIFENEILEIETNFQIPRLQFSASEVENDMENLSALFREVDGTLKYHFFSGPKKIITGHWLNETSVNLELEHFQGCLDQLTAAFEERNLQLLTGTLDEIILITGQTLSFNSYAFVWGQLSYFYYSQIRKYHLYPKEAFTEMNSRKYPDFETAAMTMREYLLALFQELPGEKMETDNPYVNQAVSLLRTNISRNIGLSEAARLTNVSPSYLSHLFQKELGTTYINYSNRLRIEYAARLMKAPGKISQIASQVGFEDSKYFSRLFKSIMGVSPREYQIKQKGSAADGKGTA